MGRLLKLRGKRPFGANHSLMANVHKPELKNLNGMIKIKVRIKIDYALPNCDFGDEEPDLREGVIHYGREQYVFRRP